MSPEDIPMPKRAPLADFRFPARVYGIIEGAAYLSGCVGDDAASLMVPLSCFARRPELGEEMAVSVVVQPVERTP